MLISCHRIHFSYQVRNIHHLFNMYTHFTYKSVLLNVSSKTILFNTKINRCTHSVFFSCPCLYYFLTLITCLCLSCINGKQSIKVSLKRKYVLNLFNFNIRYTLKSAMNDNAELTTYRTDVKKSKP